MSYALRQISAKLAPGQVASLGTVIAFPWSMTDVPRYMTLALGGAQAGVGVYPLPAGKWSADGIVIAKAASWNVPLPVGYTAGQRLRCCIRSNEIVEVNVVSPDHGTSNFMVMGTNGATNGAHDGHLVWTGTVTSISISCPTQASGAAQVDYLLYELPDITQQGAFLKGAMALGYETVTS